MSQSKKEMMNRALSAMTMNIGKAGVNDNVIEEIKRQLKANEIVKLKFAKNIAKNKDDYIADIVQKTRSKLIDVRGNVAVIYKKKHTLSGAVIGLASGWLITVIVMLLWNYLVTPLYMGYPREAVVELLLPAFLPFNLLKGGLNASITFLLYKPIVTALRKSGYVATLENEARQKHTGLLILASFIIVTCVLIILSMNGII